MQKPTRRLVKKTVIPVSLIDNPSEVCGLIHFPTEQNPKNITPNETTVSRKTHTISYKRESLNEDNEEEVYKKREIEYFDIALAPRRTKEKHFRIEVPVTKGLKSARNFTRLSELFFSFSFNNSEGRP